MVLSLEGSEGRIVPIEKCGGGVSVAQEANGVCGGVSHTTSQKRDMSHSGSQ